MIKHRHHIIPRHMGGSNESSNLVSLTIEEHAEAHRILFETYGKLEDKIAWKALSGHMGEAEQLRIELARQKTKEAWRDPIKRARWIANFLKCYMPTLQQDRSRWVYCLAF